MFKAVGAEAGNEYYSADEVKLIYFSNEYEPKTIDFMLSGEYVYIKNFYSIEAYGLTNALSPQNLERCEKLFKDIEPLSSHAHYLVFPVSHLH